MRTRGRGRGESACRHDGENRTDLLYRDTALFWGWVEELDAALTNNVRTVQETRRRGHSPRFLAPIQSDIKVCLGFSARKLEYATQHALQFSRF